MTEVEGGFFIDRKNGHSFRRKKKGEGKDSFELGFKREKRRPSLATVMKGKGKSRRPPRERKKVLPRLPPKKKR